MKHAKVFLVGAGPGDPDLLTLKAHQILQEAEVIVYDDLIEPALLARYSGEKISAGKRKGKHHRQQREINALLLKLANEGKRVVRLKGGDPFIFGRGGEEVQYLLGHSVEVEVIPGITTALAAAAALQIPLTQRGIASSLAFCTGHPKERISVPEADTLVYYMGATTLQEIVKRVLEKKPSTTPIAIVREASRATQEIVFSTLAEALENNLQASSPSLIIISPLLKK